MLEIYIGLKRTFLITKIHERSLKKYRADNNEKFILKSNSIDKYNEIAKKIANSYLNGNIVELDKKDYLFKSIYNNENNNNFEEMKIFF